MTKDVISLSISVLLLFRHYISHKITFGAPSSGGVLCSACGAFIVPWEATLSTKSGAVSASTDCQHKGKIQIQQTSILSFKIIFGVQKDFVDRPVCLFFFYAPKGTLGSI